MRRSLSVMFSDLHSWQKGWFFYIERKLRRHAHRFEKQKSYIVDLLMARRGTYQRPFLHFSLGIILIVGVLSAPILADSYPGALPDTLSDFTPPSAVATSLDFAEYGVETQISEKPRDQVIEYSVQDGDTLSSIAEQFGVSSDSIKWANKLPRDTLRIKQTLKIPPVTGIVHKVREGETIYSVAKKYKTDPQKIVNFPFNDFTDLDTFALAIGQTLVVPDGVQLQAQAIVSSSISVPTVITGGTGQFLWPTTGGITQYPVWYHMAVDIADGSAPGIAASDGGVVTTVQYLRYAYGYHVIVNHGDGFSSLYAHMSEIYVQPGDQVSRGQVIGRMGSTGRSTGTHLHFELRKNGVTLNPLNYLVFND
ncbi:peptidoglycan DD-metalloendopeptidase family protein [Patescibacteria group bacterium]